MSYLRSFRLKIIGSALLPLILSLASPDSLRCQTQLDAGSQAKNLPVYNVKSFGVKGDDLSDDTIAIKAALAAVNTRGGGYLFFPKGVYYISSGLVIPFGVQVIGLGWSTGLFGTVIKANPNFTGSAPFPGNMMLSIDGATDTYGAGASNLTLDCNGVAGCGGLYRGHANEQNYFRRINVVNFSSYGLYICGAGENSDAPNVCGGTSNSGAQGDGPDEDLQFYPNQFSNPNTLAIVIRNDPSYRGLHNVTINTFSDAAHQPTYAGWFSGSTYNVWSIHMEGPANGLYLGPAQGPLCPKNCNGLANAGFSQIDLNTRGGPNAIVFNNVQHVNLANIEGSVLDQQFGQNLVSSGGYVGFLNIGINGQVISNDANFGINVTGPAAYQNPLTVFSAATPQFVVKNSTGPTFPYLSWSLGTDGTLSTYGQGGTGNWLFTTPGAVLGVGSTAQLSGLNMQSPFETSTGNMRGTVCSSASWSKANQNWSLSNNGGTDYTCSYFPGTGGFAVSTSATAPVPGTITQAQFVANTKLNLTGAGSLILGPGAATAADSGQTLQVNGGMQLSGSTRPTCSATTRGTFWFLAAAAGSQDHVQVCGQNASGTLGWQQVY